MRRASFMDHDRANFFSGPYLERRAEAREDPDWIASARADPATLYLVGHGTAHLLHADSPPRDRKSTRLNSSHQIISYAVFCLQQKKAELDHVSGEMRSVRLVLERRDHRLRAAVARDQLAVLGDGLAEARAAVTEDAALAVERD